jgi:hypothetical protein
MRTRTVTALVAAALAWPSLLGAAPKVAERTTPARSVLPGKPTGPIAVEYRVAAAPAVGVPLEIVVTARAEADVSGIMIEVNASAPQSLLVTAPVLVTAGDGGVYSWNITVVPLADEAGYLSVIVAGRVDGLSQARSVTVPLHPAAAPGPGPAAATAGEERLIALPAQESP